MCSSSAREILFFSCYVSFTAKRIFQLHTCFVIDWEIEGPLWGSCKWLQAQPYARRLTGHTCSSVSKRNLNAQRLKGTQNRTTLERRCARKRSIHVTEMKCNGCWTDIEPKTQAVASACGHLFCKRYEEYLNEILSKVSNALSRSSNPTALVLFVKL